MKVETDGEQQAVEVQVSLDDLDREAVRQERECVRKLAGSAGGYVYHALLPVAR